MSRGAPSLSSMAIRALTKNADSLQSVGDLPYHLVRPILKTIVNPQQLRAIEVASPQIAGHDAELWKAFIARDVLDWKEKMVEPKNPASWWKVYRKLMNDDAKARAEQEKQLVESLSNVQKQTDLKNSLFVREVLTDTRAHLQSDFVDGVVNPKAGRIGVDWVSPNAKERKPSLKNAKTGREIMSAIRRQSAHATREKGRGKPMDSHAISSRRSDKLLDRTNAVLSHAYREHSKTTQRFAGRNQTPSTARSSWTGTMRKSATPPPPGSTVTSHTPVKATEHAQPLATPSPTAIVKRKRSPTSIFAPVAKKRRI